MSRSILASIVPAALVAVTLALATPAHAAVGIDSTTTERWRLENGLEVRVRNIPGASGVAIAMGYRAGQLAMPPNRPGLAAMLAELQFTSAAGDVPERSRDELSSVRPDGWDLRANDYVTVLSEIASRQRFPGVLQQVAARAHGVQISDSSLSRARAYVRAQSAQTLFGDPTLVLYHRIRGVAEGASDTQLLDAAAARGIASLTPEEATQLLKRYYVPANASLSLAGDFTGLDLRALVHDLFGDIPAGTAQAEAALPARQSGWHQATLPGLTTPIGAVGVIAPALEDTLHPSFYLASLIAGGSWYQSGGRPMPPIGSAFNFAVMEDPTLVRFNVPPARPLATAQDVLSYWQESMYDVRDKVMLRDMFESTKASVDWLLGGPLPPPVRRMARVQVSPLNTIAITAATQALWKGDAFWDQYRTRFEQTRLAPLGFVDWMLEPQHQVALLLLPKH